MEIKTKFNVGDKVWYVAYDHLAYDCPICEEEAYETKPIGVRQGDVEQISGEHNLTHHKESYKIICKRFDSGICAYTDRQADSVFATKHQAEQAYADELEEYNQDRIRERNHLIEWVENHYGIAVDTH